MELFLFIFLVIIFYLLVNSDSRKNISDTIYYTTKASSEQAKKHSELQEKLTSYDYDSPRNNNVNNYYTQNNIYVHTEKPTKKKKKRNNYYIADKNYKIKYSEERLAQQLLENYGSKRQAKDILVKQYGVKENKAKQLVGYRKKY